MSYTDDQGTPELVTSVGVGPIANVNDAPVVDQEIADASATVGAAFSFTLDSDTFADVDTAEPDLYSDAR